MPFERRTADRPLVRLERRRAWAATIFFLGLLLFVWPFVRTPPLPIGLSYGHLLASWLLVVVALLAMSRPRRHGRERGGRRDG